MAFTWKNIFDPSGILVGGGITGNQGLLNSSSGVSDRERYNQQLQGRLNNIQAPNLTDYYSQQRQQILGQYKQPSMLNFDNLNKFYNTAQGNLNQQMGQQVSDASAQAGALAGARGLANPSGFVNRSANQVRQSFAPQFGQLEANRAQAQFDIEKYNNALQNQSQQDYLNLLMQLAQQGGNAMQGDYANQLGLFNAYSGMSGNYDPYSERDKFMNFIGQVAPSVIKALV